MISIIPSELSVSELQGYLQGAVAPRPIALASTVDVLGCPNLSPFSFFNIFSANPPILVFSPARRVRDHSLKHTLINCEATNEVVINVVSFDMVQQMSLSSTEYPSGVNEFLKSGFTPIASHEVKPFRVLESPIQLECKVNEIKPLGTQGGAGHLIICEVVKIHINPSILDADGSIDPEKIDLVSRLGKNWYSRAKEGLFEVAKPLVNLGIGVDAIPMAIQKSTVFCGNDLGKLGNIEILPNSEEINTFVQENLEMQNFLKTSSENAVFEKAKAYLDQNQVLMAWKVLLAYQQ
ncbi:flavin reductase family protein [Flavobacterium branchiophilum]|uniref:Flavin reductase like domain-containing protein n=1 Tax=Flavobacterium branchiophilum (strain FL-15) TaxID=1034807 RepID=G2Z686_FLABF|nr:flavin reductase family protein [Flavobacterium branchiophilum]CCB70906.1 Protein of unknown function [Flavobacterium branchiophilum FL-15]